MSKIHQIKSALSFYLRAQTRYNVHSPIVFDFVEHLLEDERQYYAFEKIERLRKKLLKNNAKVKNMDFGAGSHKGNAAFKTVKAIAATALSQPKYGELLFKMVQHYRFSNIIELGTSLGITSAYLASPNPSYTQLHTLEGNPEVAAIAKKQFAALELKNVNLVIGQFEETLPSVLNQIEKVDLVFFDGNHQLAATLKYFESCLPKIHEGSIFVFDDIYWSGEMTAAWTQLKQHPSVSHSIDLYQFGILFFNKKNQQAEHYQIIRHKWKPWSSGFFG